MGSGRRPASQPGGAVSRGTAVYAIPAIRIRATGAGESPEGRRYRPRPDRGGCAGGPAQAHSAARRASRRQGSDRPGRAGSLCGGREAAGGGAKVLRRVAGQLSKGGQRPLSLWIVPAGDRRGCGPARISERTGTEPETSGGIGEHGAGVRAARRNRKSHFVCATRGRGGS